MTTEFNEGDVIAKVTAKLQEKNPTIAADRVEAVVREEVQKLARQPVQDYVSVLSERAAKKRLKSDDPA